MSLMRRLFDWLKIKYMDGELWKLTHICWKHLQNINNKLYNSK